MKLSEIVINIGREGLLTDTANSDLRYPVRVIDAKVAYGSVKYLITPLGGLGEVWVSDFRLKFEGVK
jgi:hypothetical protein